VFYAPGRDPPELASQPEMGISIDFLNLLDRRDHNIDYDCASRIDTVGGIDTHRCFPATGAVQIQCALHRSAWTTV